MWDDTANYPNYKRRSPSDGGETRSEHYANKSRTFRRRTHKCRAPVVDKFFNGEAIIQLNYVGNRSVECNFCLAKNFEFESPNMCCFNGKVHVEDLPRPPQLFFEPVAQHRFKEQSFSEIFTSTE